MSLSENSGGCHSKCTVTIIATVFGALAAAAVGALIYLYASRRWQFQTRHRRLEHAPPVPMKHTPNLEGGFAHHEYWTGSRVRA